MRKVRVGVIGLGSWGECHLEAYSALPNVEVAAVCSRRPERLKSIGDRYGIAGRYTNYEDLVAQDLDLVSVVTAESEHYDPVVLALESGKHVLVEKPVSLASSEAREMLVVASKNRRRIVPGHVLRFDARYARMYQELRSHRLGAPVSLHLRRSRPRSMFATYRRVHTVYELTVHDLDIAIWYTGSRVVSVKAYARAVQDGENTDLLWSCLEFENGAVAILESNWLIPDEARIVEADSAEIIGSEGVARFDASDAGVQIWDNAGRSTPDLYIHSRIEGRAAGALREQLSYVCDCLASEKPTDYLSFQDAVHGIEVCEAVLESARTGQVITDLSRPLR